MSNPTPYLKMRVLGAIEFAQGKSWRERIKQVSQMHFTDEDGRARQFTWRTIETWRTRYQKHGATVMTTKPRADKGKTRKIAPEDLLEAIEQVRPLLHAGTFNKAQIYRLCIERGHLRREQVAPNTFSRLVNQYELLKSEDQVTDKRRLAFSKQFANQMWQADTMYGPCLQTKQGVAQTRLICFIDDASRVVCHGEFFAQDNTESMIRALRWAIYKRGIPEQIYVDNGSNYSSREMTLICARLGIILSHTPVRDGSAKGKIERFFRHVRQSFLTLQLDLSSLEKLNRQFTEWAEDHYNNRVHGTLGMKPIDRFGLDRDRVRWMPPDRSNNEFFFLEEERLVKNDNTFSLQSVRMEAPADLRGRTIQVRFERGRLDQVIVYHKGQRVGPAQRLDAVANDRPPKAALERAKQTLIEQGDPS